MKFGERFIRGDIDEATVESTLAFSIQSMAKKLWSRHRKMLFSVRKISTVNGIDLIISISIGGCASDSVNERQHTNANSYSISCRRYAISHRMQTICRWKHIIYKVKDKNDNDDDDENSLIN